VGGEHPCIVPGLRRQRGDARGRAAADGARDPLGQRDVVLCGWVDSRRDHGGVLFLDVRDTAGIVQVVVDPAVVTDTDVHRVRGEYVVRVEGSVRHRPDGTVNDTIPTGEVEVGVTALEVLSEAETPPFPIDDRIDADEVLRLRYRYLDLRRPRLQRNLRIRARVNATLRHALDAQGFVEVETPMLIASTPEGARDFVVPSRLSPGAFYALPQSPQLFKQLLMVGGLERYFQIARCYRDEDFRADRQPEFTQLDIEMSFVGEDDVIAIAEDVLVEVWRLIGHHISRPIPRMTYAEAMSRYGTDKPDLRFGLELTDLTQYFKDTSFRVFQAPYVGAVVMPGGGSQSRRQFDAWQDWAKQRGARGLAYIVIGPDGELSGPVAKNLSDSERGGLAAATGAQAGDAIFFGHGNPLNALSRNSYTEAWERIGADALHSQRV
jgi:aspartyl-tRNA synthetase